MKALRKTRSAPGASVEVVPVPTLGPNDVLVRVRSASICGTDLHIYEWDHWSASRVHPPMTFGHEFCGIVERVGEDVTGLARGDFVTAEMHVACGRCRQCRLGQSHVCQNLSILGVDRDGCFAEFVRIPAGNIWPIDPGIPEHYGAILDPLGNAVHAVLAGEITGQTVAVTGCGPIGLMSIAVAKACGASAIFATEVNEHRRDMAATMGAADVLDPSVGDAVARVRAATGGAGVDVLLEMSGNPQAIESGLAMLRSGGRASLLGIPPGPVTLDLTGSVITKGVTIHGIFGRRMFQTWVQMTELIKQRRLDLEPLFHERLPLERFAEAFSLLEAGLPGKVILCPNGSSGR
jgi:threonine 3-dehydrogenase